MTIIIPAINHYRTEFSRAADKLPGRNIAWLQQTRADALRRFTTNGFPTNQDEAWKYTNVTAIERNNFTLSENNQAAPISNELISTLPYSRLLFINGHYAEKLSHIKPLPPGVTVTSLAKMLALQPQQVALYLGKTLAADTHAFIALNTAFMQDGAYIHLMPNAQLTEPLHLIFITTQDTQNNMVNLRNLIIAEAHSKATIIESHISLNTQQNFINTISEIIIRDNATIEHYKLQQENEKTYHIGTIQVQQHAHSTFNAHTFTLGGLLVRSDTHVQLAAEHAACSLNGLYLAHNRQHIDHHTVINHAKPYGTSREYYKGVLTDRARAVFNGKVIVALDAEKTDAQQTNKNLLLSQDAEIDTKPQLEIFADDVQCTHGAAVGQLDSNSLFYLRTRGMSEQEARNILIYAFVRELIETVSLMPLRDHIQKNLFGHLPAELIDPQQLSNSTNIANNNLSAKNKEEEQHAD